MTAVILVAPNNAEVTVGSLADFVDLVYGQGYHPKTGSIDSNKAALHGGAAPSPDPAALVRLGDLQTPTSDAAIALHGELLPKWKPTRSVVAGELYLAPDGQPIQRIADGTTRASYDTTEQGTWSLPLRAAYGPVVASDNWLKAWGSNVDNLIRATTITRDANGAATAAGVVWPDGAPGTYTADTVSSAFPGAVDAYHITYGSPATKTITQPAVTRDSTTGAVTNRPALTVA